MPTAGKWQRQDPLRSPECLSLIITSLPLPYLLISKCLDMGFFISIDIEYVVCQASCYALRDRKITTTWFLPTKIPTVCSENTGMCLLTITRVNTYRQSALGDWREVLPRTEQWEITEDFAKDRIFGLGPEG